MESSVSIIAAIGRGRQIGKDNDLLWNLPADRKRFKTLTQGRPVIMGRETFESIVAAIGRPLDSGRTNIVLTRNSAWEYRGAIAVPSIEEALSVAKQHGEYPFVIGGENIYLHTLIHADRLYLTLVDDAPAADTFFPPYEHLFAKSSEQPAQEFGGVRFQWVEFERKRF
jgi:dihydrofolate reductase